MNSRPTAPDLDPTPNGDAGLPAASGASGEAQQAEAGGTPAQQTAADRAAARAARREANRARWAEQRAEQAAKGNRTKGKARQEEAAALAERSASRAKRDLSDDQQAAFLELYAAGLTVSEAAAKVGASSSVVFRKVRDDDAFRSSFFSARETNTDHAEDALAKLASEGNVQAILAVLRARRPAVWREHRGLTVEESEATRNARRSVFLELVSALERLGGSQQSNETKAVELPSTTLN